MPRSKHLPGINDKEEFEEKNKENCEENTEIFEEEDEPDYLDNFGQLWKFIYRVGGDEDLEEFISRMEGGMMAEKENNKKWKTFGCADNDGACPFQAIFLRSCFNLYSRGEHNHGQGLKKEKEDERIYNEMENMKSKTHFSTKMPPLNIGDDYVDHLGKSWKFYGKVGDSNPSSQKLRNAFGFARIYPRTATMNMYCWKEGPGGKKCQFAGVYLRTNGCMYTRGEHQCGKKHVHEPKQKSPLQISAAGNGLVKSIKGNESKNVNKELLERVAENKKLSTNLNPNYNHHNENGEDYVDRCGKLWRFYGQIGKNATREMMNTKFGFSNIQISQRKFHMYCKKPGPVERCKFGGIYFRDNGCLYVHGKHVHNEKVDIKDENLPLSRKEERRIFDKNRYVDQFGTFWPLVAKIGKNIPKEEFHPKFGIGVKNQTTYGFYLRCNKSRKDANGLCRFRAIYVKSNGCLYAKSTKHDHTRAYKFTNIKK